jgi:hypothetical protein
MIYWVCIREESTGKLLESHSFLDYKKARKFARGINEEEWSVPIKIDTVILQRGELPQ